MRERSEKDRGKKRGTRHLRPVARVHALPVIIWRRLPISTSFSRLENCSSIRVCSSMVHVAQWKQRSRSRNLSPKQKYDGKAMTSTDLRGGTLNPACFGPIPSFQEPASGIENNGLKDR